MERNRLEFLTMAQLQEVATKEGLPSVGDRNTLIDLIMSHQERSGATGKQPSPSASVAGGPEKGQQRGPERMDQPVTASMFLQYMQQQQVQQQQQQRQFEQLILLLSARGAGKIVRSDGGIGRRSVGRSSRLGREDESNERFLAPIPGRRSARRKRGDLDRDSVAGILRN
ncbi:hypothetical protein DMN91_002192 [Ooceraea biroi]|uniref:SAP domain-containing protein n=1 Tax=Ooceraea biroi TaxID=2015173 RepID=A0A3L8E1G2_OOCBI|nr:hypothetical protein DMN91_002192 [Ooceraea biroi]